VTGRRTSRRISALSRREYGAAIAMLEADFYGEERDYCTAHRDFKRQPPLDMDRVTLDLSAVRQASSRMGQFASVFAAPSHR
jgi:hypothetical protein